MWFSGVLCGQGLKFKKVKKFIQRLHVPSPGHWITVTNYGVPEDTFPIYNSLDEPAPASAVCHVAIITLPDLHDQVELYWNYNSAWSLWYGCVYDTNERYEWMFVQCLG